MNFRPSEAIIEAAKKIAAGMPKRQLGGIGGAAMREYPRSWKNRRIIDAATMMDARQRYLANPKAYPPERETRQQKRRARMRGPHGV